MQQSSHTPFVREFTSEPPQVSRQQGYQREILFTKSRQCAKENLTQNTSTLLDDQQNHCFSCWDWFERNVVVLKGMLAWKEYVKEHLTLERYLFSLFEIRETVLEESTVSKERNAWTLKSDPSLMLTLLHHLLVHLLLQKEALKCENLLLQRSWTQRTFLECFLFCDWWKRKWTRRLDVWVYERACSPESRRVHLIEYLEYTFEYVFFSNRRRRKRKELLNGDCNLRWLCSLSVFSCLMSEEVTLKGQLVSPWTTRDEKMQFLCFSRNWDEFVPLFSSWEM